METIKNISTYVIIQLMQVHYFTSFSPQCTNLKVTFQNLARSYHWLPSSGTSIQIVNKGLWPLLSGINWCCKNVQRNKDEWPGTWIALKLNSKIPRWCSLFTSSEMQAFQTIYTSVNTCHMSLCACCEVPEKHLLESCHFRCCMACICKLLIDKTTLVLSSYLALFTRKRRPWKWETKATLMHWQKRSEERFVRFLLMSYWRFTSLTGISTVYCILQKCRKTVTVIHFLVNMHIYKPGSNSGKC